MKIPKHYRNIIYNESYDQFVQSVITRTQLSVSNLEIFQGFLKSRQEGLIIEHYIKQTPKQWLLRIYEELDEMIVLESINCEIPLSEIYAQNEFDFID
jgi:hypothetical protein